MKTFPCYQNLARDISELSRLKDKLTNFSKNMVIYLIKELYKRSKRQNRMIRKKKSKRNIYKV